VNDYRSETSSMICDGDEPVGRTPGEAAGDRRVGDAELPAGIIQPTGAKVDIPCADFFYMRDGKIERFECYPVTSIMLKQMGVLPDFASAVKRSTQR
jgi:hypothetical protein